MKDTPNLDECRSLIETETEQYFLALKRNLGKIYNDVKDQKLGVFTRSDEKGLLTVTIVGLKSGSTDFNLVFTKKIIKKFLRKSYEWYSLQLYKIPTSSFSRELIFAVDSDRNPVTDAQLRMWVQDYLDLISVRNEEEESRKLIRKYEYISENLNLIKELH
jgi:hypothetical protein